MSIINFTPGDVLRSRVLDQGWASFVISSVTYQQNKEKDAMNWKVIFTLIDKSPELDGKVIERYFSDKAPSMMLPLIYAARGIKMVDKMKEIPEGFAFDTEELVGKKVDGNVKQDTYQGNINNKLEEYAPYKSAVGAGPAF